MTNLPNESKKPQRIELKISRTKFAAGLFFVVVCWLNSLWSLVHIQFYSHQFYLYLAEAFVWTTAICFGLIAFCKNPVLVQLDNEGVKVLGWVGCPVAWNEIEAVWIYRRKRSYLNITMSECICMTIKGGNDFLARQRRSVRWAANRLGSGNQVHLYFYTSKGMSCSANQLVGSIQTYAGVSRQFDPVNAESKSL